MDRPTVGSVQILRGNALALALADESVDLIVTSPPYFGLRSYQDGGEHYAGQIGDEPTPAEFVDALIAATAEMVRVLKPSGSIWVNLGDKYAGSNGQPGGSGSSTLVGTTSHTRGMAASKKPATGAPTKSLIGIPWRYAIRCIDDLGLILRAEVIWSKPNGLPESVTDRVRRSHETWFHFTREPRYFSAVDEIRERYDAPNARRTLGNVDPGRGDHGNPTKRMDAAQTMNPLGKLPGSVWTIPTEPLHVPESLGIDHFAAFPTEWPRRIIQGWSPSGICTECGEGRRPVSEVAEMRPRESLQMQQRHRTASSGGVGKVGLGIPAAERERTITGEACACPEPTAPTRPAVVLDPFGGTGTTALVAKVLGRHGISVDMSADYCRLATWRTTDPDQIARAMRVDKPARQVDGQADLFDHLEETL